jgi:protein farnesyltransferase subunit beta
MAIGRRFIAKWDIADESRGTYCLLVVATLLDLLTPELLHNVDKFIAGCQTYEGGFACASYDFAAFGRAAKAEAHGGYTSCALNSHFLLSALKPALSSSPSSSSSIPSPSPTSTLGPDFPAQIDVAAALRWTVLMQGEGIEAGGFRGRSNKLVDGCYSWWVGGGVPVLEELARREKEQTLKVRKEAGEKEGQGARIEVEGGEEEWEDVKRESFIGVWRGWRMGVFRGHRLRCSSRRDIRHGASQTVAMYIWEWR